MSSNTVFFLLQPLPPQITEHGRVTITQRNAALPGRKHGPAGRTTTTGARRKTGTAENMTADGLDRIFQDEAVADIAGERFRHHPALRVNDIVHVKSSRHGCGLGDSPPPEDSDPHALRCDWMR